MSHKSVEGAPAEGQMVPQEGFSCTRSPQRAAEAIALTAGNVYMHVREEKFLLSPLECDICDFNVTVS